ncbi:hypothetical protein BCR33DRAFT_846698 [Rhizoclosmatium globosum]|uniref:N-acetyltransferase domain-containing protein n=1 Tax=Rhizoclosmatium globosum TaxID=329046 RepID=A0A1Y2CVL4_9FUNG|nr:hypothetical protein BCR33DRAFT_846698 [Rhizoclosmatium globosum]|eukprot:ORY51062.1 hypothetical protein BCR33DRAFT_846698 [Rhizoclosmatium globosum]
MIRPVNIGDRALLIAIGDSTGLFDAGEAEELLGQKSIDHCCSAEAPAGHQAHAWHDPVTGTICGWTYFGPCQVELNGIGVKLLEFAEKTAWAAGATKVLINTASDDKTFNARQFYVKQDILRLLFKKRLWEGVHQITFCKNS